MIEIFSSLSLGMSLILIFSLGLVFAFEFINGFHDTANAVATVIHTKCMRPFRAVFLSGIFNFLGVFFGGLAVAYSIINLLPLDLLASITSTSGLILVFSLLVSAIIWNLGTWYFGIPASSSHTLIGSILGVGLAHAVINGRSITTGVNWGKAIDVFLSLLLSPLVGGGIAAFFLIFLIKWKPFSYIHKTPKFRHEVEKRKRPPFWPRFVLICSAMVMSFTHGSNDGQKGVGLVMLVLFSLVPGHYVLNMNTSDYEINKIRSSIQYIQTKVNENEIKFSTHKVDPSYHNAFTCYPDQINEHANKLKALLGNAQSDHQIASEKRWEVRNELNCLANIAKKAQTQEGLSSATKASLKDAYKDLTATTQYSPFWVIVAIATALGMGTMIGWKRVVETVGTKIGKKEMTYAQGISAQVTAGLSIGLATHFGLPVSTTHILSSSVAGTMVANRSGLQLSTIKSILMAWILTLPVTIGLSFSLYWLGVKLFV